MSWRCPTPPSLFLEMACDWSRYHCVRQDPAPPLDGEDVSGGAHEEHGRACNFGPNKLFKPLLVLVWCTVWKCERSPFHLLLPWKGKKWRLFCTISQQRFNLLNSHFHSGFIYYWTKFLQIKNPLLSFIFIFMLRHLEEHFKHLKFYKHLLSLGNNELFCLNTIWALGNLAK